MWVHVFAVGGICAHGGFVGCPFQFVGGLGHSWVHSFGARSDCLGVGGVGLGWGPMGLWGTLLSILCLVQRGGPQSSPPTDLPTRWL